MKQLYMPTIEVDLLATEVRRQIGRVDDLLTEAGVEDMTPREIQSRLREIEVHLRQLCAA